MKLIVAISNICSATKPIYFVQYLTILGAFVSEGIKNDVPDEWVA